MLPVSMLFITLFTAISTLKWGPQGHSISAQIAQHLLTPKAHNMVKDVLNGEEIADVASWADRVKHSTDYRWSGPLHFINTPDWLCDFSYRRDCVNNRCVAGAIGNYTVRVASRNNPNESLKFLIHYIGDIHQPLHVGFIGDKGGNTLKGHFLGHKTNLHQVWDSGIIHERLHRDFGGSEDAYVNWVLSGIRSGKWVVEIGEVDDWADESVALACSNAYVDVDGSHIEDGFDLGEAYYQANVGVLDSQLVKAGVRLAYVVNNLYK